MASTTTRMVVREHGYEQEPALWTLYDPGAIPSVGQRVEHYCEPRDHAAWNPDVLTDLKALNKKYWEVVLVHHEYNRVSIEKINHTIFVYVKSIPKHKDV